MPAIKIDLVSDIVCPWCIVGYRRLQKALESLEGKVEAEVEWHPFELNPTMPDAGQNMGEHLAEKYGSTPESSAQIRGQLTDIGTSLDFEFKFSDDSRMWNTFTAHRVLHWAREQGKQTEFKLALFEEHFTKGNNPSDPQVLADVAERLGLDGAEAAEIANSDRYAGEVRSEQQHFRSMGITAVPTYIINSKYAISGAQEPETIAKALVEISQEAA